MMIFCNTMCIAQDLRPDNKKMWWTKAEMLTKIVSFHLLLRGVNDSTGCLVLKAWSSPNTVEETHGRIAHAEATVKVFGKAVLSLWQGDLLSETILAYALWLGVATLKFCSQWSFLALHGFQSQKLFWPLHPDLAWRREFTMFYAVSDRFCLCTVIRVRNYFCFRTVPRTGWLPWLNELWLIWVITRCCVTIHYTAH